MSDLSLDHVGAIVRDLDAGAERWRRLGFLLSPRSPQMGFDKATGRTEPWATSNHCAVFGEGYLELIGVTDPDRFNPWQRFLDRFEGVHITALRCANADRAYAEISTRTDGVAPPLDRRRQAPYRGGTREMRFRNIFSRDEAFPEGRFIVIEHQTPELIWQEELMEHPNGAVGLAEVHLVAREPEPTVARIAALTGVPSEQTPEGTRRFTMPGGGTLEVLTVEAYAHRFGDVSPPPSPSVAACTIGVRDLDAASRAVEAGGVVPDRRSEAGFSVAPSDANGVRLLFRTAD